MTNAGSTPLTIVPARLALIVGGDATLPDGHGGPCTLAPGLTAPVRVHYHAWTNARCDEPMAVSFDGAVAPSKLRPMSFVPEASDT